MAKTLEQAPVFRARPERLYRIYLSSREHAAACGWGRARIAARVGGRITLAPHISGKFLWLVPGRVIVQTWRGSNWTKAELDSFLILVFQRHRAGCRLMMIHANVPDGHAASIGRGWHTYYWQPWKAYLRRRRS